MLAGKQNGVSGFTLIELLVTIAVAVIIMTIAVPSFQNLISTNRLAANYNDVLSGLSYARSEAVKRREVVTAVLSRAGDKGWRLEIKVDDGTALEAIDCTNSSEIKCLLIRDESDSLVSISTDSDSQVSFNALGRLGGTVCKEIVLNHDGKNESIKITLAGRVGKECV